MPRTALLVLACLVALGSEAWAQADYPSRPVRVVVNSAPGGGTDILARVLAQQLSRGGQSFFVENRGGGGGIIGIEAVINAPRDGYTLLMTPSTVAVLPAVTKQARYDAAKDLTAITQVAGISNVLVVHPDVPAKTLQELIALAKAKPGTPASATVGTFGRADTRLGPDTARARSLPASISGLPVSMLENRAEIRPDSTSVIAGPVPLNGMCCRSIPAICLSSSMLMCGDEPAPAEA